METSARAAAEFLVVVNICTQVGHRLLTSAELLAIAASSDTGVSIGLTMSEWSGTVVSETLAITVGRPILGPKRCATCQTSITAWSCPRSSPTSDVWRSVQTSAKIGLLHRLCDRPMSQEQSRRIHECAS